MKIALRADNDRYVCAEDGGGSVVRANRDAIGPWETFEVVGTHTLDGAPSVALKTSSGFYLCAEAGGGGTLSANRLSIGPWETFTFSAGTFLANDEQHYICCEVGSPDPILNVTRTAAGPWETFDVVVVETDPLPPSDPTMLKGAFCIPAESGRVWWPAFLAVSADEQDRYIAGDDCAWLHLRSGARQRLALRQRLPAHRSGCACARGWTGEDQGRWTQHRRRVR